MFHWTSAMSLATVMLTGHSQLLVLITASGAITYEYMTYGISTCAAILRRSKQVPVHNLLSTGEHSSLLLARAPAGFGGRGLVAVRHRRPLLRVAGHHRRGRPRLCDGVRRAVADAQQVGGPGQHAGQATHHQQSCAHALMPHFSRTPPRPAMLPCRCVASANSPIDAVHRSIRQWLQLGLPRAKFVLGLPWYGYDYPCQPAAGQASVAPDVDLCLLPSVPFLNVSCSDAAGPQHDYAELMQLLRSGTNTTEVRWAAAVVDGSCCLLDVCLLDVVTCAAASSAADLDGAVVLLLVALCAVSDAPCCEAVRMLQADGSMVIRQRRSAGGAAAHRMLWRCACCSMGLLRHIGNCAACSRWPAPPTHACLHCEAHQHHHLLPVPTTTTGGTSCPRRPTSTTGRKTAAYARCGSMTPAASGSSWRRLRRLACEVWASGTMTCWTTLVTGGAGSRALRRPRRCGRLSGCSLAVLLWRGLGGEERLGQQLAASASSGSRGSSS
jgi:hypothetical protein